MKWRDIEGYEGIYQISDSGLVRSLDRIDAAGSKRKGRKHKQGEDKDGYKLLTLCKFGRLKTWKVHRLVAAAFCIQKPGADQVNHVDGDKSNNSAKNLEWATIKENMAHAKRTGLKAKGERSGKSKLKESDVKLIRRLWDQGKRANEIAQYVPVTKSGVEHVVYGRCWSHL